MDNSILPPWESIDPALTPERLDAVATIIREETDAKVAQRDSRDMNWNLGCDCHAWVMGRMHRDAKGDYAEWLFMVSRPGDLDLQFRIGGEEGVLAKYYRPDSPGQPHRTLKSANDELDALQTELGDDFKAVPDPAIRFAIDKDATGRVTAVRLVQLTLDGEPLYVWPIWTSDAAALPIADAPMPEGVELDEPEVALPEDEEAAEADKKRKDSKGGA